MAYRLKPDYPSGRRSASNDVPWLARLTHPLVFFGAALAVYEGTIGTALLTGKHSDRTVIWLCVLMAVVILTATGIVALLVFLRPENLMLGQQDKLMEDHSQRIRKATTILLRHSRPKNPSELLQIMDEVENVLRGLES